MVHAGSRFSVWIVICVLHPLAKRLVTGAGFKKHLTSLHFLTSVDKNACTSEYVGTRSEDTPRRFIVSQVHTRSQHKLVCYSLLTKRYMLSTSIAFSTTTSNQQHICTTVPFNAARLTISKRIASPAITFLRASVIARFIKRISVCGLHAHMSLGYVGGVGVTPICQCIARCRPWYWANNGRNST